MRGRLDVAKSVISLAALGERSGILRIERGHSLSQIPSQPAL